MRKTPTGNVSRRRFIGTAAGAGMAAAAGRLPGSPAPPNEVVLAAQGAQAVSPAGGPARDLTLVNGRIYTMDARNTVATTVTVRNGRFAIVGPGGTVAPPADTQVINLGGRTVVPGLIEPHIHSVSLANRPGYHTILENTTSIREIQEALAARRKSVPEGQWITSMGGWHPNQWAEHRHPTLKELDEAVPDRPVLLYERFTGPCATNSLGKKFFDAADAGPLAHPDITRINVSDTGVIAPAGANGGPSPSALFLLRRMQTFDDKKRSTLDMMAYSASVGLTAHLDQVLFPTPGPLHPSQILSNLDQYRMYDSWLAVHREGRALIRLQTNFLQNQSDPELPELKERLRNQFPFFGDDMMMTGGIGEWAAPLGSGPAWSESQRLVAQAGWRNENSAGNLAALEQIVDAYEAVNREFDITGLRWVVHIVPEVRADLLNRLKALGCGVQMGAFRWVTSTDPKVIVGPPFRTIIEHGVQTGMMGDGVHIAPLNPWLQVYFATTGVNSFGARVNGNQQLTREEALRLFTRNNSWFLRMEEKIGTIEPGKLADLVVLDRDYFAVPDVQIKQIRSVLTVVDGKIAHNAL